MMAYDRREKPYVVNGPCMLQPDLQRTQCSLFLDADEDDKMTVFRARQDAYKQSYTFSDLPDIPSAMAVD